jgi:ATP-dependent protease ClpP protease subunit
MSKVLEGAEFESFHLYDVHIPSRTIAICDEVDDTLFKKVLKNIFILDQTEGEINILLSGPGGDLSACRGIYDVLNLCTNVVKISCYGEIASASTIILMAGDERRMTPNSKLMVHIGESAMNYNHPKNIEEHYHNMKDDNAWIEDIYLRRIKEVKPRYTRQQLQDLLVWDKYIKPSEALDLGLITHIWEEK